MGAGPVGCGRPRDDRMDKSAARPGHHAVAGVCQALRELGRARQTMRGYREAPRPLPEVRPGTWGRDVLWRWPRAPRRHQRLRHPCAAGALGSGRTAAQTLRVDGRARQRQQQPGAQWRMRRLEQPAGAMRWADFLHPQPLLAANHPRSPGAAGGAAQRGPACRRGVWRWGRCGRKLAGASRGTTGRGPRSLCHGGRVARGASSGLTLGGLRVARAGAAAVLAAIPPAGGTAAVEARARLPSAPARPRQALALAVETARDAAQRAPRQEDRVAPDHRLGAGDLARRWHETRAQVAAAAARLATWEGQPPPGRAEPPYA
jgi:hypothetical protein